MRIILTLTLAFFSEFLWANKPFAPTFSMFMRAMSTPAGQKLFRAFTGKRLPENFAALSQAQQSRQHDLLIEGIESMTDIEVARTGFVSPENVIDLVYDHSYSTMALGTANFETVGRVFQEGKDVSVDSVIAAFEQQMVNGSRLSAQELLDSHTKKSLTRKIIPKTSDSRHRKVRGI